jgi:hypothetical protein
MSLFKYFLRKKLNNKFSGSKIIDPTFQTIYAMSEF